MGILRYLIPNASDRFSGDLVVWDDLAFYDIPGVDDRGEARTEKLPGQFVPACYDMGSIKSEDELHLLHSAVE